MIGALGDVAVALVNFSVRMKKLPEKPRPRGAKDDLLFRERLDAITPALWADEQTPGWGWAPAGVHRGVYRSGGVASVPAPAAR